MFTQRQLISSNYTEMQRTLHAAPRGYGGRGNKWAGIVMQIASEYGATSILDYGAGAGTLAVTLKATLPSTIRVSEYDPAIKGKESLPDFADLVVCTDVLEHIEPECLDNVLAHLRSLARKALFIVVSTKASNKVLSNGKNAHLIIRPARWWKKRFLVAGFTLHNPPTVVRQVPEKEWVVVLTP